MQLEWRSYLVGLVMIWTLVNSPSTVAMANNADDVEPIQNLVLDPLIKSVQFYPVGRPLDMPIIEMDGFLVLRFDDLGPYFRDLRYTIIHCDRNWRPSTEISDMEYLTAFEDGRIDNFLSSNNTRLPYVNHELVLPNPDVGWKLSGNYILKVWDVENDDQVILTLRFTVFERPLAFTDFSIRPISRRGRFDDYVDLRFEVRIKDLNLDDPQNTVTAGIIQNYDWNSMRLGVKPGMVTLNEIVFNRINENVFASHKPYRFFDMRSMLNARAGIRSIERFEDGIEANLELDHYRVHDSRQVNDFDINGGFVISSIEQGTFIRQDLTQLLADREIWARAGAGRQIADTRGEYVSVLFTLEDRNFPLDEGIYVLGKFNQYTPDTSYRMEYSYEHQLFYKEVILKQGVYDYMYGTVEEDGIDYSLIEGYSNVALNDYHIIIYYRPFADRYDRVLSYSGPQG